jgi:UDP-N-acetylmuramoyl-tripeptide--D-alanyl-D-alanine ligase
MKGKVCLITGTVGETTTRSMLLRILSDFRTTTTNVANLNILPYVFQYMASTSPDTDCAVFECGFGSTLNELRRISDVMQPDIVVMTQLDVAHLDVITKEPVTRDRALRLIGTQKLQLADQLRPGGAVVLNADMPLFDEFRAMIAADHRVISFGERADADVRLLDHVHSPAGAIVSAQVLGVRVDYRLQMPSRFMALNSLAALAAAHELGIGLEKATTGLSDFGAVQGRAHVSRLHLGGRSITLLDDSFNATPLSVRASLSLLGELAPEANGRRIAVLGDIAHLGVESAKIHAGLVEPVMEHGIDLVYTFGSEMRYLHNALPRDRAAGHFMSRKYLADSILANARHGDVIGIKASIPAGFPKVVRILKTSAKRL